MIQPPSEREIDSNLSKRRRHNAGVSKCGGSVDFCLRSEDLQLDPLRSEDILLGDDLFALSSKAMSLKSADIVKGMLLSDSAVTTASAAMKPDEPSTASNVAKSPNLQGKIGKLKSKLERRSTGNDPVSLNTGFRISSGSWIKDFESEPGDFAAIHPSLFWDNQPSSFKYSVRDKPQPSTSPRPLKYRTAFYKEYRGPTRPSGYMPTSNPSLKNVRISSSDWINDFQGEVDSGPMHPSLFMSNTSIAAMGEQLSYTSPSPTNSHPTHSLPSQRQSTSVPPLKKTTRPNASPSRSNPITKTSKKSRKRVLDETRVVEPTDGDVLCGRGGFTNMHPGNIRFRQKALEFRPWYEESSKDKKQEIADLLVDFVKNEGHRFLGKSKDGSWHEMIGDGPHHKASQALRERIKGQGQKAE